MKDEQRLGFKPRIIFPLSGVTFEGRQEHLAKASALFEANYPLDNHGQAWGRHKYGMGLWVVPEPKNQYDPNAIAIHLATALSDAGELVQHRQVGYVPKACCPGCSSFVQVARRDLSTCPHCGMLVNNLPELHLNEYLTKKIVDGGKSVAAGAVWLGRGAGARRTYGARIALWWDVQTGSP